ncbi:MAG: aminoglycoside phosphotransferase family protein, partial [Bacteroidota bacterium]
SYIIRLNQDDKLREYLKEKWCLEQMRKLGIPSPKVIRIGQWKELAYVIQNKVPGRNGEVLSPSVKKQIWAQLGKYATRYQQIHQAEDPQIDFILRHRDWQARLLYNLEELNQTDSLLEKQIFTPEEHSFAQASLASLLDRKLEMGLVHGDLCPRNVVVEGDQIHLLDWGTAEINVVPHTELGILMISEEASPVDFQLFLDGMGLSGEAFKKLEKEIQLFNFLHRLDKYRWAEAHCPEHLSNYAQKVRMTYELLPST